MYAATDDRGTENERDTHGAGMTDAWDGVWHVSFVEVRPICDAAQPPINHAPEAAVRRALRARLATSPGGRYRLRNVTRRIRAPGASITHTSPSVMIRIAIARWVRASTLLMLASLALVVHPVSAQSRAAPDSACSYRICALSIVPTWNGLAVARGAQGPRVANLQFLWPRDISAALAGPGADVRGADSAAASAHRAVRLRRVGAALTDAGIVLAASAAIGALHAGRFRRTDGVAAGVGGAALALSVPFQFAADGALSRAVWWHNLRFAP